MEYEATKKSVRLNAKTVKTIHDISGSTINFSGGINQIFERYNFMIEHSKPNFTDKEWLALAQCYKNKVNNDFEILIERMQWDIDQSLQHDSNFLFLLGISLDDRQSQIDFCERIRTLNKIERLALLHTLL